jgi:hypothetical protein
MTNRTAGGIVIVTILWAVIAMAFMLDDVWGVDFNRRLRFVGDYDSVRVVFGKHYADSSVLQADSFWVIQPKDTLVTVVKSYDWDFRYMYYSGADSIGMVEFVRYTAGAATISSTDKEEIAHYVEDTNKYWHGAGSHLTGGGGTASDTLIMYALDTSGTDATVQDVKITILNPSGEVVIAGVYTDPYGKYQIALDPASGYSGILRRAGYIFPSFSFDVSGDDDSVPVPGYNIALQASPDPSLCRVQGYIFVSGGKTGRKITVTFTNDGGVYNSCDATAFINEPVTKQTDATGFFYADLIPSGCLLKSSGDSLQWTINASLDGNTIKKKMIYVPQEESYEVVW